MSEVKFSKEHEWIRLEGEVATVGITKHATEMLLALSGRTHTVFSGLAVSLPNGKMVSGFSSTEVRFRKFEKHFAELEIASSFH